jgi:nucleoid-associated protein YgaU
MSRETKVGLLVGLGFIVVFSILLSHSGSAPVLTQNLPIVVKPTNPDQLGDSSPTPPPVSGFTDVQSYSPLEGPEDVPTVPDRLPGALADLGPADELPLEAPPLQPTTPQPATRPAVPASTALPKPYVVRRGDGLEKIAKRVYGRSSPSIISHIMDANNGTIKDRDTLRVGQVILTPPVTADLVKRPSFAT